MACVQSRVEALLRNCTGGAPVGLVFSSDVDICETLTLIPSKHWQDNADNEAMACI